MNDFAFLTVTREGGNPVIRRKTAADVVPESASPVTGHAAGSEAVIPDAAGERVFRSVRVNIEPVQAGSGDPSPSNIRPVSGRTGANVHQIRTGDPSTGASYSVPFPADAGTVYGGVLDLNAGTLTVDTAFRSFDGSEAWVLISGMYFGLRIGNYGGVIDRSGVCSHFPDALIQTGTTMMGQRIINSQIGGGSAQLFIRPEDVSGMTPDDFMTLADFKAWLAAQAGGGTPVQIAYRLTNPVVYTLSPVRIAALAGENTVWADCGPVEVDYVRDTGAAIEAGDASTRAMIGEASGETASRSLAVGEYVTVGDRLYRVTSAVGAGETLVPGSNVAETTVGEELTGTNAELAAHETDAASELEILARIADRIYGGRNLGTVFASEIAQYSGDPWAWIKARITAGNFDGIHVGDYIPWTDKNGMNRNARIMGINTYRDYGDTAIGNHIDFFGGLWQTFMPINLAAYNNGTSESAYPWLASDAYLYANSLAGKVPLAATANPTLTDVDHTEGGIWYYLPDSLKTKIVQKRMYLEKRYTAGQLLTESNGAGWADLGKIWFPTEFEVYGAPVLGGHGYAAMGSAVQYPLFAGNIARPILNRARWWLLNPSSGDSTKWCNVNFANFADNNTASVTSVMLPICFRIA